MERERENVRRGGEHGRETELDNGVKTKAFSRDWQYGINAQQTDGK